MATLPAIGKKQRHPLFTALFAGLMMLLIYAMLGVWPFGGLSVLTGELSDQYIPYFSHFKRAFLDGAGFAYGFDKGLGGSLAGIFAFYVASPLNLLYLLAPLRWFPIVSAGLLLVKVVLASSFCCHYILRRFPALGWFASALGLCYGFMAYNFAYAQNIMFHDVVLLLPLICLGVDNIIRGRSFALYTITLTLAVYSNFYTAFMACIFLLFYFAFSMCISPVGGNLSGWKRPTLRFLAGLGLAWGMCAALLLPAAAGLRHIAGTGTAAGEGFTFLWEGLFPLGHLPEKFLWGSFSIVNIQSTLPFVYCGILISLLVFCYFASSQTALRERLLAGGLCLVFLLSFWLNGLDTLWHGFAAPAGFPARYSFLFCFFLVLLAAKALASGSTHSRTLTFAGGVLFLVLLVMAAFPVTVSRSRVLLSAVAVIFFTFALLLYDNAHTEKRRRLAAGVMLSVVALELAANGFYITNQFQLHSLQQFQSYADKSGGTVQAIQAGDAGNYRIAENSAYSLNDPMALGYSGIMHSSGMADAPAQATLDRLGYRSALSSGPYLAGNTAFADALLGIKYLYMPDTQLPIPAHWHAASSDWHAASSYGQAASSPSEVPLPVYENPYHLPLLFATRPGPAPNPPENQNMFIWQNQLYLALGGEGTLFAPAEDYALRSAMGERQPQTRRVQPGDYYELTATATGYHYAWFRAASKDLLLYVGGVFSGVYFSSRHSGVISLGWLEAGQKVTIAWEHTDEIEMNDFAFVSMDDAKLAEMAAEARQNAGSFTWQDGLVEGTVFAPDGGMLLYTSIPWDENWQATLNGHSARPQMFADGLLALPLAAGENTVSLRYHSPGSGPLRWAVSLGCLVLFVLLLWRTRRQSVLPASAATAATPQPPPTTKE